MDERTTNKKGGNHDAAIRPSAHSVPLSKDRIEFTWKNFTRAGNISNLYRSRV